MKKTKQSQDNVAGAPVAGRPFITKWKGIKGEVLRIPIDQPLNNWDVSRVQKMGRENYSLDYARGMFQDCSLFNQPLDNWDMKNVQSMGGMFINCTYFYQDLGMWNLASCEKLGLDNCGMSAESYSKSLLGWAAQPNINDGVNLDA